MKQFSQRLKALLVASILMFVIIQSEAQDLYNLDLADGENYTTTCGTINGGQWFVKNNYCSIITSPVVYPGNPWSDPSMIAPVSITINSTGNLRCWEGFPPGAFIRYSINNGPWITQNTVTGCDLNKTTGANVLEYTFDLFASAGASVRIMVSMVDESKTDKLAIRNGGIAIGQPVIANSNNWTKKREDASDNNGRIGFSIYPNPSIGREINVELSGNINEEVRVAFFDIMGKEVYSQQVTTKNGMFYGKINIADADLSPGVYLVTAVGKAKTYTQRLVIR